MNSIFCAVFVLIGIFTLIFEYQKYKTIFTPVTGFSIVWAIVGCVSNIGLYDYYLPSLIVNLTILLAIIIFQVFYYISITKKMQINIDDINNSNVDFYLKSKIHIFINIVLIIISIPLLISALKIINKEGFAFLRANTQQLYDSSIIGVLFDSIIRPLMLASILISVTFSFSQYNKSKYIYIILSTIEVLIFSITNASRASLVAFIFYYFIAFLLFRKKGVKHIFKNNKLLLASLIALVIAVLFITENRAGQEINKSSFMQNIYIYYFSGPTYFSQILSKYSEYGLNGKLLYGQATFGFITNWFSSLLTLLTKQSRGSLWLISSKITNVQYYVSPKLKLNSICTAFYPFILDYGYLGILIGPVVLSLFTVIISKKLIQKKNVFTISIYIYWIYVLIRTLFKWDLLNLDFSIILMYIYFITKKGHYYYE